MIRRYFEKAGWGRLLVMVVGNIFLGLGIAVFKLSGLGNDPYSGMVMALSDCVGMAYANFLVLINLSRNGSQCIAFGIHSDILL